MTTGSSEESIQRGLLIATIVLFIGVGLSVLLNYDDYLKAKKEKGIFTDEDAYYLLLIDRIVFAGVFIAFLYFDYLTFENKKQNPRDYRAMSLILTSNAINILAGLIALYVTIVYPNISGSELEEAVF